MSTWTERCDACEGRGWQPTSASTLSPEWRPCQRCGGRGQNTWREIDWTQVAARQPAAPEEGS